MCFRAPDCDSWVKYMCGPVIEVRGEDFDCGLKHDFVPRTNYYFAMWPFDQQGIFRDVD